MIWKKSSKFCTYTFEPPAISSFSFLDCCFQYIMAAALITKRRPVYISHVECRVHIVDILLVQFIPQQLDRFANTGNMKYRKRATNTYYRVTVSYRQSPSIVVKL